jgi:hypothetical protein
MNYCLGVWCGRDYPHSPALHSVSADGGIMEAPTTDGGGFTVYGTDTPVDHGSPGQQPEPQLGPLVLGRADQQAPAALDEDER